MESESRPIFSALLEHGKYIIDPPACLHELPVKKATKSINNIIGNIEHISSSAYPKSYVTKKIRVSME